MERIRIGVLDRPILSARNKVLATLLLSILGVLGNYASLSLVFGVDFIFGSIAVMLAILMLGKLPAVIVAMAAGAYTIFLWGHPYALLTFTIEALLVSLLYERGLRNLVLVELIFWGIVGIPLVLLLYHGIMGMEASMLVAFKQMVNALFNALLAGVIVIVWQLWIRGRFAFPGKPSLASLLFHSLLGVTLLAGITPIINESHIKRDEQTMKIYERLNETANLFVKSLELENVYENELQRYDYHLEQLENHQEYSVAILSKDGTIISQRGDIRSLSELGEIKPLSDVMSIWLPNDEMLAMQRWRSGVYTLSLTLDTQRPGTQLLVEYPIKYDVKLLEEQGTRHFMLLTVIFVIGVLLNAWLSKLISRPLIELEKISSDMADKISKGKPLNRPFSRVQEYSSLGSTLYEMGSTLAGSFDELRMARAELQSEVAARTKALTRSSLELESVLAAASEFAIIATDRDGLIKVFNSGGEKMLGYAAEELVGKQTPALFHLPEEVEKRSAELSNTYGLPIEGFATFVDIVNRKGSETREWSYKHKDGHLISVSLTVTQQTDDKGCLIGYLGIAEDITERKLNQKALQQFKKTLDQTLDCVYMFDAEEMHFFYANEGALKQIGYCLDELLLMRPFDIKPEIDEVQFRELVAPLLSGEQLSLTFETFHQHKKGHKIPVEIFLQYLSTEGEASRFVAFVRDVSERRAAELALRKSEQRFRDAARQLTLATEVAQMGVWDLNLLTGELDWDAGMLRIYGIAEQDFGHSYEDWVQWLLPEDVEQAKADFEQGIANPGSHYESEFRIHRLDEIRHIRSVAQAMLDSNGHPSRIIGINEDITERKHLELVKNEFVSTVSHELRTPLTSISGALGLVIGSQANDLPERVKRMINIAYSNSQRLTNLINDLLDIEKISAGKVLFTMQVQPLLPLVEKAIENHKTFSIKKQIKLILDGDASVIMVNIDSNRLEQVLANLLSNAIKFSPEEGTVRVTVKSLQDRVRVTVVDQGQGVPEVFYDKIFEKFSQADSSDSRQKGGTGLGLAISRELIEHMSGSISFDSVEGKGAAFWFELPLVESI